MVGFLLFSGALTLSVCVIYASIAPQWRRIAALTMGRPELPFAPLGTLVSAERRIAVRRWATVPARQTGQRAAA